MTAARAPARGSLLTTTAWALAASALWTSMAVVVRYLEGRVPSTDISFYRALTALLIGIGPMLWQRGGSLAAVVPKRELFGAYLFRGILIFSAQAAYYYALTHIALADAAVLNATAPIFSAALATVLIGERVVLQRWLLVVLGFVGVVVIIRPGFQAVPIEALAALASAALYATANALTKNLVGRESGTAIVYGTNFVVALVGLAVVALGGVLPSWFDLGIIAAIGATGAGAQYCIARALVHGEVSYVSPFEFTRVPFVAFAAWVLFGQVPGLWFWIGAALVFAAVFMLARHAARRRKPVPANAAA